MENESRYDTCIGGMFLVKTGTNEGSSESESLLIIDVQTYS